MADANEDLKQLLRDHGLGDLVPLVDREIPRYRFIISKQMPLQEFLDRYIYPSVGSAYRLKKP